MLRAHPVCRQLTSVDLDEVSSMPQIDTRLIAPLPGDQIAKPDLSFGNFMEGFKLGMQRKDPLEQLKRMEVEQALQMNAAKMADQIAVRQGMVELATVGADISSRGAWTDPKEKTKVFEVLKRNPMLATTGAAANVMGQFDVAEKLQQAEQLHTLRMETEKSRQAAYTAQTIKAMLPSQNAQTFSLQATIETRRKTMEALRAAEAAGDQSKVDELKGELALIDKRNRESEVQTFAEKENIKSIGAELRSVNNALIDPDTDPQQLPDLAAKAQELRRRLTQLALDEEAAPAPPDNPSRFKITVNPPNANVSR